MSQKICFHKMRIKVIDETDTPIIDVTGNSKKIKEALKIMDDKFN